MVRSRRTGDGQVNAVAELLHQLIAPFESFTAHQLDVLRTLAACVGSALIPVMTFLLVWGVRLLRRVRKDATAAREQTVTRDFSGGVLKEVSVAETARHLALGGASTRPEPSEPADWSRGAGRRREPTRDVPRIDPRSPR
jgi:hypothetical protein